MKLLDVLAISCAAYCLNKLRSINAKTSIEQLSGSLSPYSMGTPIFSYLEDNVQTILLQCFPYDYTTPRTIEDQNTYVRALEAANKTGAPLAWVQKVASINPNLDLMKSSANMLVFSDDFVKKSGKSVDLVKMREQAIMAGLR